MKTILIFSDSHASNRDMKEIIEQTPCDLIFHLGDHGDDLKHTKLYAVKGNCDRFSALPEEILLNVEQLTFLLVHGHRQGVKLNLSAITTYAAQKGADVVCFGHTHQALIHREKELLLINPGSISLPRIGDARSYMILTVRGDQVQARLESLPT